MLILQARLIGRVGGVGKLVGIIADALGAFKGYRMKFVDFVGLI